MILFLQKENAAPDISIIDGRQAGAGQASISMMAVALRSQVDPPTGSNPFFENLHCLLLVFFLSCVCRVSSPLLVIP